MTLTSKSLTAAIEIMYMTGFLGFALAWWFEWMVLSRVCLILAITGTGLALMYWVGTMLQQYFRQRKDS